MNGDKIAPDFYSVDFSGLFLPMITAYESPADYPGKFVARVFDMHKATNVVVVRDTFDALADAVPPNFVFMIRSEGDEAKILGTWL